MALEFAAYGLTAQDLEGSCFSLASPAVYTEFEALRTAQLVLVTVKAFEICRIAAGYCSTSFSGLHRSCATKWCGHSAFVPAIFIPACVQSHSAF